MVRESGVEMLRIFAALAVVMLHYNDAIAFDVVVQGSLNYYILFFLESICICAVDVFMLISGFFLCSSNKRTLGKPLSLFVQISLVQLLFFLFLILTGQKQFSIPLSIETIIPANYFVILYTGVYLVSPYINKLLQTLSKKQLTSFLLLLLFIFSFYATFTDILNEFRGNVWFGMSPISAWGNMQGFNIVNFCLLYIVGAYLRIVGIPPIIKKHSINICLLTLILIFVWAILGDYLPKVGLRSAWVYNNPLVILLSILLFSFFSSIKLRSMAINTLAKSSFTCFLVHQYIIGLFRIEDYVKAPFYILILHIFATLLIIYLLCWLLWKAYDLTIQPLVLKMDKITLIDIV